jgi:hypothetical protein
MASVLEKIKFEINKGNPFVTFYDFFEGVLTAWFKKIVDRKKTFSLEGRTYKYYYHRRNRTWENERTIEIPLIWDVVSRKRGQSILEVGNVLSRYFEIQHDVVDKYEKNDFVHNADIVDYRPDKRYDLIVSISTLEHVGFDEQPVEPGKIGKAIKNLESLVNPGGEIHVTLPVGYNPSLDQSIDLKKLKFTQLHFFKRKSSTNDWQETVWDDVKNVTYYRGKTWHANGLVYAIIKK